MGGGGGGRPEPSRAPPNAIQLVGPLYLRDGPIWAGRGGSRGLGLELEFPWCGFGVCRSGGLELGCNNETYILEKRN